MSKGLYDKVTPAQLIKVQNETGNNGDETIASDQEAVAIQYDRDDQKARALILTSIEAEFVKATISCRTAREVWERLIELYEEDTSANKIVLQKDFYDIIMSPGMSVKEYIAKTEYIAGQLKDMGQPISDELIISKIVSGLSSDFKHFFSAWMGTPESERTIKNLSSRLRAEENQMRPEREESTALHVNASHKSRYTKQGDTDGRPDKRKDKKNLKCYYCHKLGHFKRDCRKRKAREGRSDDDGYEIAIAEVNNTEMTSTGDDINVWVLDTGASDHMIANQSYFSTYKKLDKPRVVRYGNKGLSDIIGVGDVKVTSKVGHNKYKKLLLRNVLHVPQLGRNLLSLGAASDQGSTGIFTSDKLILKNKAGEVQMIGHRISSKLWRAELHVVRPTAYFCNTDNQLDIWHERLGHVGHSTIESMIKNNAAEGMNESDTSKIACKSCLLGKQARKHFPSRSRKRAEVVGQRVHVDVCGPIGTPSLKRHQYFVLFKDEFSNYRHIYFIEKKDEVHQQLRIYVNALQNETNKKVRTLVSDRGSELTSRRTQEFLLENGISHEVSAPFTPQQNGLIERDNRTVIEAMRTMLFHRNLPDRLWNEAAGAAVYLLNRVCNKNTANATPFERYFERKPRLTHLRAYGCLGMMKMQEKKRSGYQRKLEHRAKETALVGYDKEFTYRLFDPQTNQVYVTRDVIFDETKSLGGSQQQQQFSRLETFFQGIIDCHESDDDAVIDENDTVNELKAANSSRLINADTALIDSGDYEASRSVLENGDSSRSQNAKERQLTSIQDISSLSSDTDANNLQVANRNSTNNGSAATSNSGSDGQSDSTLEVDKSHEIATMHNPTRGCIVVRGASTGGSNNNLLGTSILANNQPNVGSSAANARRSSIPRATYQLRQRNEAGLVAHKNNNQQRQSEANICSDDYEAVALVAVGDSPECYEDATERPDANEWKKAMIDEYQSLMKNETWTLVNLPPDRQAIKCKWVYKVKRRPDGSVERFKARLVAKGCSQKYGFDYTETYSPVARLDSLRLVLSIVAQDDLEMKHFDVRTAFLYGSLNEEIYMQQPQGFIEDESKVCKLQKSLYGLKQASKCWNECFTNSLQSFGLQPLQSDSCIFVRRDAQCFLIILIYVDDGLACSNNKDLLDKVIDHLQNKFEMSVMDPNCFLGLEIKRNRQLRTLHISQRFYIDKLIDKFRMREAQGLCTPADSNLKLFKNGTLDGEEHETVNVPYRQLVGSLMYAVCCSRPDIAYATCFLASYSESPKQTHWTALKRILRYLKMTPDEGLLYNGNSKYKGELIAYSDADHAGDVGNRRSTTGYILMYNDAPIYWKSQKQSSVSLSTTESEFVAACYATCELMATLKLLRELGRHDEAPIRLMVDNQSAISLIRNPNARSRIKHIDIKFKFVQEKEAEGIIKTHYISSNDQVADILTKALPNDLFENCKANLGMQKKPG